VILACAKICRKGRRVKAGEATAPQSIFPTGLPIGTCQQALDTACGLYLNDPTAWT
jgi:hypothetical protein